MSWTNPFLLFSKTVLELKVAKTFEYSDMASKLARDGRDMISFGIGQPDFQTPKHIVEAAVKALREGLTRYVSPPGIPELREEIARHVSTFTGAGDVKSEETLVTAGAKHATFFAISSYIKPGDEVIIPDPSFYSYTHVTRYAGGKPVFIPLKEENGFSITAEDVQRVMTSRTRMIILNSPHNPTGGMLRKSDFKGILEVAKEKGVLVASDEVYDHYTYEQGFMSALEDPDWRKYIIYINSLSKTYAMTGWRLGYIVARKEAIRRFSLFTANTVSCTAAFVQKAGVAALTGAQNFFDEVLQKYKKRRDLVYKEINRMPGIRAEKPAGAFYIFPNIREVLESVEMSSEDLAIRLMKEYGVVVLPGSAFPNRAGEGYLRISYALPIEKIKRGLERLRAGIEELIKS